MCFIPQIKIHCSCYATSWLTLLAATQPHTKELKIYPVNHASKQDTESVPLLKNGHCND